MANNGWKAIGMWAIGALFTTVFYVVIVISIPALSKEIKTNDKLNTKDHKEIRKEYRDKIDGVKDIVTEIRLEQREMLTILKKLDK